MSSHIYNFAGLPFDRFFHGTNNRKHRDSNFTMSGDFTAERAVTRDMLPYLVVPSKLGREIHIRLVIVTMFVSGGDFISTSICVYFDVHLTRL